MMLYNYTSIKKTAIPIIITAALIFTAIYGYYKFKKDNIKNEIYSKQSIELKKKLIDLIKQKQGGTASLTLILSNDNSVKSALLKKDKSLLDFGTSLKELKKISEYKNMWIQVVDKDGYNFYRSWMDKSGDYMPNARKDIAIMIKDPKPMNHISTGKFDMTFKTMRPIYHNGTFIGMIEMITHFNSIADKLAKESIEPVMIVDKSYTKGFMKPFTNIFIGENYVANLNASKILMDKIKEFGIEKFININNYMLFEDYIVTNYKLKNIKGGPMGNHILFYKLQKVDMSKLKSFELSFLTGIIGFIIAISIFFGVLFLIIRSRDLKKFNGLLEIEKEKALKAADTKSYFLANMSHEIRTPLNAILGFIDLLKDESHSKKSLEYIKIIDKSSNSLLEIIEDILDFSKIERGKLTIEKILFDPQEEFKTVVDLFAGKCMQNNITLNVNIEKNMPGAIKTDILRLKQILSNLISNAVKFTEKGKNIFVTISYNDKILHLSVKDEGKGIEADKLEHIFEAFSQEDISTTRKYGGTGLGLAISSELVKLLGGELKVKSTIDKGSEFYFSIPVDIGNIVEKEKNIKTDHSFEGKKILLVEDNKANQMLMEIVLNKMGLSLVIANDGIEAIEAFKANRYDAVLMDENMPNMNGIEAARHILKHEEENNLVHTPIIALTANALKGDRERFLKAGMDEYLTKPIDKQKLGKILSKFFN